MRLCAALALVLVALVVLTVKAGRRPARGAAPASRDDAELAPAPARAGAPSAPAQPAGHEPGGIAHLRGHVLFPAGVKPNDHLDVTAEDPSRTFAALVGDDGRFEVHLPSGRYTLIASMDELVGVVPDFFARAGAGRDIDIRLAAGAAIRGTVTTPADASVKAFATDRDEDEIGNCDVVDGRFAIEGLIPGRRYDLVFDGQDVRRLTVTGVTAPADGMKIEMQ